MARTKGSLNRKTMLNHLTSINHPDLATLSAEGTDYKTIQNAYNASINVTGPAPVTAVADVVAEATAGITIKS